MKKQKIKLFSGQELQPDCGIELESWDKHSATLTSCIIITWVSLNRISLKRSGGANHTTFVFIVLFNHKENS